MLVAFDATAHAAYPGIAGVFFRAIGLAGYCAGWHTAGPAAAYLRLVHPFDCHKNPAAVAARFWHDTNSGIGDGNDCWSIRAGLYGTPGADRRANERLTQAEFTAALAAHQCAACEASEFVTWLQQAGYDGLVMHHQRHTAYAVFAASQVRAAY